MVMAAADSPTRAPLRGARPSPPELASGSVADLKWQPERRPEKLLQLRGFTARRVDAARFGALPGPLITLIVGGLCVALGLSVVWKGEPSEIATGFWPPAGVALVAYLVTPKRRWGWVALGILVPTAVGLTFGFMPVTAGLLWAAGNLVEPALAAYLLRRFCASRFFTPARLLAMFVLVGVVAAPMVGAAIGAVGTAIDYPDSWASAWIEWVMADGLGVLIVVPFFVVYAPHGTIPSRTRGELIGVFALVTVATALAFVDVVPDAAALLPYLMLATLIWAGMRFGRRAAAGAGFVVAMGANVATSFHVGPFSAAGETAQVVTLPLFIAIALITSFVVASMASDLADRDSVRRLLTHQATHDALTGLPNELHFHGRVDAALRSAAPLPSNGIGAPAVLLADLEHFRKINDRYGQATGDQVLCALGERMAASVGDDELLARVGDDEFGILIPTGGATPAAQLAQRLVDALGTPVDVGGDQFQVPCRVGIAVAADHLSATDLVHRAGLALQHAKQLDGHSIALFDDAIEAQTRRRVEIAEELPAAIESGELRVEYQPVLDLATGRVSEFEALSRWTSPRLGVVRPDEFIAVAEDTGVISRLGDWVLEVACHQLAEWRRGPSPNLRIAVNVSTRQLSDVGFPARVRATLAAADLPADAVTLEITETALMDDITVSARVIGELLDFGVRLSMDDFGTGFSSISNLRRTPLHVLKIDRSFVVGLGQVDTDTAIVESIIHLGHSFGLDVVAEGVETAGQLEHLIRLGCEHGQGFLWSKAVPADRATDLLARRFDMPSPGPGGATAPPARGTRTSTSQSVGASV
jgi:diguanylate cyclase (GGDEF)-like protein